MNKAQLVTFLQTQLGDKSAVLGLSGGVDSAVVAYLLAAAIGPDKVHAMIMPAQSNVPTDTTDAQTVIDQLGIHSTIIQIDEFVRLYQTTLPDVKTPLAIGNLKARIRMSLLYAQANTINGLVVGTGNKSELSVGYFTKYGDGGVDLLPLGNLYKTQVWALAKELGVPATIIDKAPSAGLWPGQTDEAELGMTYQELDAMLQAIEQNQNLDHFDQVKLANVRQRMVQAKHKLAVPPIA